MLAGERRGDLEHPHPDDVKTFSFESPDDFADQTALNTVGFEQYQRRFHGEFFKKLKTKGYGELDQKTIGGNCPDFSLQG
jgi:hypothetical protein